VLKRIRKKRLSDEAVDQIQKLIMNHEIKPGSRLPAERKIMSMLGISRTSVREALRILEIMGLITVKPGSGAFVKELTGDLFLPLSDWLPRHKETLRQHFEARLVIEPQAAAFASQRATARVIQAMKECLDQFVEKEKTNDIPAMILADAEFHRLVAQATGNRTLMILMDTIARSLFEGWKATLRIPSRRTKTVREHHAILKAIEEHDQEAAKKAMSNHLKKALSDLAKAGFK
jgi:GntR family transcriptional regulator, transcriptional repressor for pyruvate dehydrogenase complex